MSNSLEIGDRLESQFLANLPNGFYDPISSPVKTMKVIKRPQNERRVDIIDLQSIFLRLLLIGQRRLMTLEPLFAYELCSAPPSLIDQYGCLRKSNKAKLVKSLAVVASDEWEPEFIIVDALQLLYHVAWSHGGTLQIL